MRVTSRLAGRSLRKPAATHPLLNRMGSSRPYVLFSSWVQRLMTPYQTSDLPSDMNGSGDTCHELWPDISWTPRPSDEDAMKSFSKLWPEIAWTPRASPGIEAQDLCCSENQPNTTTPTEDAAQLWPEADWTPRSVHVLAPLDTDSVWPYMNWSPHSEHDNSEGRGTLRKRGGKGPRSCA